MTQPVDGKYYQFVKRDSLPERLMIRARDQIYADFIHTMAPRETDTIVDVGVSDIITDGANVLERKYPFLDKITACGLGEATTFREAFPDCLYRRIVPNIPLPFEDNAFTIATANAVLEHVGSFDNQKSFIEELCRISRKVFISVPHRYFPVEHHTTIPLLHYNDTTFKLACMVSGRSEWCEEVNLVLMTQERLRKLTADIQRSITIGHTGLKLGPVSSNPYMTIV